MLDGDENGVVSESPDGLARMMAVVVVICQGSDSKTESQSLWSVSSSTETTLHVSATGEFSQQTAKFVPPGGAISAHAELPIEITASARHGHVPKSVLSNVRSTECPAYSNACVLGRRW